MTPTADDQLTSLAEQRHELNAEGQRLAKAYCLAVLDHVTAKIRAACPEAVYVTFAFYSTRTLDLHGVLGAQTSPLGTCPELWNNREGTQEHPLGYLADEIESDVQTALVSLPLSGVGVRPPQLGHRGELVAAGTARDRPGRACGRAGA